MRGAGNGVWANCQHCGMELDVSHTGNCPYCGKSGKAVKAFASVRLGLVVAASAEKTQVYYEWRNITLGELPGTIVIDVVVLILTTGISALVSGLVGAPWVTLIGFGIGLLIMLILNTCIRKRVREKVREITRIN